MPLIFLISFFLDDRAYQQFAKLLLLVEKRRRSDQVGLLFGVLKPCLVQATRPQLSRGYVRALSPVSSRIFTSSSIYD